MKKVHARRARDQARVKKLHSAHLRNVGADIAGIQSQIQTKKEQKDREKQEEVAYSNQQQDIQRYLTQVDREQELQKRKEIEGLRQNWLEQSLSRSDRREADLAVKASNVAPINVDSCSLGAVQKFDGEDPLKEERKRLQALQLQTWIAEQTNEKKVQQQVAKQADKDYAVSVSHIVSFQDEQQQELERRQAQREQLVFMENKRISLEKAARVHNISSLDKRAEEEEVLATANSVLLTENPDQSISVMEGRVRPDHWKGMSKEQCDRIKLSNAELIDQKKARVDAERQDDVSYAAQQRVYKRYMEQQEYEGHVHQAAMNRSTMETLAKQAEQAKEREAKQKRLSQGEIQTGFFDGFGTSYR